MMKAKILEGGLGDRQEGLGDVSHDLILKRAGELALSDGRNPNDYTDEDYVRAEDELRGLGNLHNSENRDIEENGVRLPEEAVATSGHRTAKTEFEDDDDDGIGAGLVNEGLEEAQHDVMVESGRATLEDEDLDSDEVVE